VGGVAGSHDGGNSVLAGDQGRVGGQGAAVGDHGGGAGEQGCPGRCGGLGDQYVAVGEPGDVVWAVHEVDRAGGASRGRGLSDQRAVGDGAGAAGLLDGPVDDIADQPCRPAEGQRRGQPPLPLP
jgi:hypothetical protein